MNFKDATGNEASLLRALARMVDHYTRRGEEFTDQRYTYPYSALAQAVHELLKYEMVYVTDQVGRVIDFYFVDDAQSWIYPY